MNANRFRNALALEAVKGKDHFLLVYPNTPTGRFEAKQAVRTWLLDCEAGLQRPGRQAVLESNRRPPI